MASRSTAGGTNRSRPSVLVVDDDPGTLESMTALLRHRRMHVHAASSGEDALTLARREWLDLALIDYRLPGITGLQVASAFRAEHIAVPWVIYSGFLDYDIALEAGRLGALEAVQVPFDVDTVVSGALARAREESESVWHRLRNGPRIGKPIRAIGLAAWWIVAACASPGDVRSSELWGRCVGESSSKVRGLFTEIGIQPSAAKHFMRVLRALARVDGRVDHVKFELAAGDSETTHALLATAGLRVAPRSATVTFEYYLANQRFIPRDHLLLLALSDLIAEA